MDNSNILATLAKLEESIKGIDSAKKQVDTVVKSNVETGKAFDDLAKSITVVKKCVDDMLKAIKEKAESLDSESKVILTGFKTSCGDIVGKSEATLETSRKSIEDSVKKSAARLNGAIDELNLGIQSLNQLKDQIAIAVSQVSEMQAGLKSVEVNLRKETTAKADLINAKIDTKAVEISSAIAAGTTEVLHSQSDQDNKLKDIVAAINLVIAEEKKTQEQVKSEAKKTQEQVKAEGQKTQKQVTSEEQKTQKQVIAEEKKAQNQMEQLLDEQKETKIIVIITMIFVVAGIIIRLGTNILN